MSNSGIVVSVNISKKTGTIKRPVSEITIDHRGVVGDAHAGLWHRQVSLLSQEDIDSFMIEMDREISPGEFAENITVRGVDLNTACILDKLRIDGVEFEVTQIGKRCHGSQCAIFQEVGKCVMPHKGIFCRVVSGGKLRAGDAVEYIPKTLRILIITLSDRAFAGEYSDRSGPKAKEILEEYFSASRWHYEIQSLVLPDDVGRLKGALLKAKGEGVDVIFTLGGTGVGPRDITPETVEAFCDKTMPGVMENIRVKFGSEKPSALLSRGVAGVAGTTQIYTLPGSVRAVSEYLGEIVKTLEHTIFMIHGLDVHDQPECLGPGGQEAG
jgi:molybdenum cofactor synthesis domain-containing protein